MKTDLHPCYVLHKKPYRETSLLLDIISIEYGRVSLVARGVRSKSKHNQQALLQPFQKLLLSWSGRGEMGTLNKVELLPDRLQSSKTLMLSGFYMNELITRLLHKNESHPELFIAYENALLGLNAEEDEQHILRCFEKELLNSLGYGLVLDHDVEKMEPIKANKQYYYRFDNGPSENLPESGSYIQLSGETLIALRNNSFTDQSNLLEARALMRSLLQSILGPRPLASRQLYQSFLQKT